MSLDRTVKPRLLLASLLAPLAVLHAAERPNILLILADDLGWLDLACYGMLGGYNTCWKEDPFYRRLPAGRPKRAYAPGAFYSTDGFGDYTLDFLEEGHEGGINTPLIVPWPAGLRTKAGAITREAGHITDFMPTVLELAGAPYPQEREGPKVLPAEGVSLMPVLKGGQLPSRQIFMEHEGNRAVREGRWKLVALKDKPWELYDLGTDPTEMSNLAARETDLVTRLAQAWEAWAQRCSVRGKIENVRVRTEGTAKE